jgi:hypothetical protein
LVVETDDLVATTGDFDVTTDLLEVLEFVEAGELGVSTDFLLEVLTELLEFGVSMEVLFEFFVVLLE